ncbi:chemotaxis protein CheB [Azoarcus sp. KH32C]|uniref:chemotaxis protein CheB n=1 Tax=Azoarcus sp. KH32C TaxID=748247 RepID=UPI0002385EAF|nr:chemotaxis protein CheB [Azoarcus sp. KH32C]BAL23973.1 regulator protein [Azoarcus sp. KH32C]
MTKKEPSPKQTAHNHVFPIVGIGASAGGLEAFSEFFEHLAPDLHMAYVLVQHLDPTHKSMLADLLAEKTSMPVSEAADGMRVEPNHVYVIPPNKNLAIHHGALHLMPSSSPRTPQVTVDYFLRSLAQDAGEQAVGIILSGTASDGMLGMKMIKAEGGVTFAQDEDSAKYFSMPHASIAAGSVDFVLPPKEIAAELARIVGRGTDSERRPSERDKDEEDHLNKMFILLRRRTGVDFSYYKLTTIQRRIRRRMLLHKIDRMSDYVRLLHDRPAEVDVLYYELLINVTAFFRDPESFDALVQEVFPKIVRDRSPADPIRVWVAGCSTGEEAYSLAIALIEYMDEQGVNIPIQIFATDIDSQAIEKARAGIFPESIAQDVPQRRLNRYFTKVDQGYQIAKHIRDMCLFAKQNVVKDPPFSRLDLVSCRNLLIYLGPVLQKKALSLFHYALKPTGFLFLGVAETIGKYADMYKTIDAKHKIYVKKAITTPMHFDFSAPQFNLPEATPGEKERQAAVLAGQDLQRAVDRVLMKKYCPASVVINEQMDIVQFRGQTGDFLEPAPGEASFNLLRMAREGLAMELRDTVAQATRTRATARKEGIRFRRGEELMRVTIEVAPLAEYAGPGFFLVVFQCFKERRPEPGDGTNDNEQAERLRGLEQELQSTKEYLQSVIEQDETINEELRSANEEILSSNEELQSTNEELETAKEELQSVNEELSTVNDELETRNREQLQLNNDLSNLLSSVNIPIVILDSDLSIRRFTPLAEKHLNLISTDVGRPISDINLNIQIPNLRKVLENVIETVNIREIEGQAHDGRWYSIRIRPYKTVDNKIEGAVIAFIDIDELKRGLKLAQEARDYAQGIVNAFRHPMLVLDGNLKVLSANPSYLECFNVSMKDTEGNLLYHLGDGQWGIPRLRNLLEDVCAKGKGFDEFAVELSMPGVGVKRVHVSGRPINSGKGNSPLVLMHIEPADVGE